MWIAHFLLITPSLLSLPWWNHHPCLWMSFPAQPTTCIACPDPCFLALLWWCRWNTNCRLHRACRRHRGRDPRRRLSEPLVLIEVDPSHFQTSSGGLSHLVADVFLYHEMCSCRVVWTGERQVSNHACGPWRKRFDALQPLGDDIWLYKRLMVYFKPFSGFCDIFQCTKRLQEFNGWKELHMSRRKTQLLHTAPYWVARLKSLEDAVVQFHSKQRLLYVYEQQYLKNMICTKKCISARGFDSVVHKSCIFSSVYEHRACMHSVVA